MKNLFLFISISSCLLCLGQDDDIEDWQYTKQKNKTTDAKPIAHKLSIGTGLSSYSGDLNHSISSITPELCFTLGFRYYIKEKLTIKPQFTLVQLSGDDAKTGDIKRNLSFKSTNYEWCININYDFIKYQPRWDLRKKISPYISANIGGLFFSPKAEYDGKSYDLQSLQTEGVEYSKFTWITSLGFGTRLAITPRSNINFEARYTYAFSDYLDDVSENYRDVNDLTGIASILSDRTTEGGYTPDNSLDGTHWTEGSKRGSRGLNDSYLLFLIEYEFDIFSHQIVHPIF